MHINICIKRKCARSPRMLFEPKWSYTHFHNCVKLWNPRFTMDPFCDANHRQHRKEHNIKHTIDMAKSWITPEIETLKCVSPFGWKRVLWVSMRTLQSAVVLCFTASDTGKVERCTHIAPSHRNQHNHPATPSTSTSTNTFYPHSTLMAGCDVISERNEVQNAIPPGRW